MAKSRTKRPAEPPAPDASGYWLASRRPLQILVTLLPFIAAYEICLALVLPDSNGEHITTVLAHKALFEFFRVFHVDAGAGGLYLGGAVIIIVLAVWHLLSREAWRVDLITSAFMILESALLCFPLLLLGALLSRGITLAAAPMPVTFDSLDIWSQMAISVGAGLYEELLFRMVLIAIIHTLLVDLGKLSHRTGATVAIIVSAVAFTLYHNLSEDGQTIAARRAVFFLLAGLYFGAIYVLRGFGIVVGAHAIYDIATVLMMGEDS